MPSGVLPHDAKWRVVSKEDVALLMHELYAADAMDPEIVDLLIECRMPLFAVRCSLFAARAVEPPALPAEFHERAERVTGRIAEIIPAR